MGMNNVSKCRGSLGPADMQRLRILLNLSSKGRKKQCFCRAQQYKVIVSFCEDAAVEYFKDKTNILGAPPVLRVQEDFPVLFIRVLR